MSRYDKVFSMMMEKLKAELPGNLAYHNLEHILDVLQAAITLAELEKLTEKETDLLKVAVLFHDSGYINTVAHHEEVGSDLAGELLPDFGYDENEIQQIQAMILVTKFPHKPKTQLEKIICDADLDYLGREDFFVIGNNLFKELKTLGSLANIDQWNQLQVQFLKRHKYFTESAISLRQKNKMNHLEIVEKLLEF